MARHQVVLPDNEAHNALEKYKKKYKGSLGSIAKDAILAGLPKLEEAEKVKKAMIGGR
jgi:hypothetical protein